MRACIAHPLLPGHRAESARPTPTRLAHAALPGRRERNRGVRFATESFTQAFGATV